jgi:hypothetical protein
MALLFRTSWRMSARTMAMICEGVCSMRSALGQDAVQVPHWMQSRISSPPGLPLISSTNEFPNAFFSIIAPY